MKMALWLRRPTRRRLPPRPAPQMCAEYSGRRPNCNAAQARRSAKYSDRFRGRLATSRPLGLIRKAKPFRTDQPTAEKRPAPVSPGSGRRSRDRRFPWQEVHNPTSSPSRASIEPSDMLERIAAAPRAAGAAAAVAGRSCRRRRLRLAPEERRLAPVPRVNRVDMSLLKGIDRVRDIADGEHRALRTRPARQQRAAVGRARHGQVVAGQGGACRRQRQRRKPACRSSWSRSTARTSRACRT